jgi:hypothetical protein
MLIKPDVNQCPFRDFVDQTIVFQYLHVKRFEPLQFAPPTMLCGVPGSPLTIPLRLDGLGERYGKIAACHVNTSNLAADPDVSIEIHTLSATEERHVPPA